MKYKFIISVFLILLTLASAYKKHDRETPAPQTSAPNENSNYTLTSDELRVRLDYMLTGQIYKYHCENDFKTIPTGSVITDNTVYGSGKKVVYCKAGRDKEGYVMEGLIKPERVYNKKNKWQNDTMHNWYIRPRMRVRQDLLYPRLQGYNEENWHTKICRLEIVNTDGKVIKEVEYEGKDFWEKHPGDECKIYYSGNYRDGKNFLEFIDTIIIISGKELNPESKTDTADRKLDCKMYWYGLTDFWLDCITVYNDTYEDLMSGKYDMWLKAIADNPDPSIYVNGIYTNKECASFIQKKIKEFTVKRYSLLYYTN